MYLAGVSVRRVEDISEALCGSRVSASTISDPNQKAYVHIEEWRNRKLSGKYPYVYVDGIYLKRNWGGEFENVSILVAIGVDEDGYREVIGASEGMKEDAESWKSFLVWLKERGLEGVKLMVGDKKALECAMPWQRSFRRQNTSVAQYIFTGTCSPSFHGNIRARCQGCSRQSMHRRARKQLGRKQKTL